VRFPPTSDYDPWFTDEDMPDAIDLCNGTADGKVCPLRDACLNFALVNNEKYGVWGGTSEITRAAMRKKHKAPYGKSSPEWKWMTEDEALTGLTDREIKELRNENSNE